MIAHRKACVNVHNKITGRSRYLILPDMREVINCTFFNSVPRIYQLRRNFNYYINVENFHHFQS